MRKIQIKDRQQFVITLAIIFSLIASVVLLFFATTKTNNTDDAYVANAKNENYTLNKDSSNYLSNNSNLNESTTKKERTLNKDVIKGIYIDDYKLGISFILPSSWEGLYSYNTDTNEKCINFYYSKHDRNNQENLLFSIYVDDTSKFTDSEKFTTENGYKKVQSNKKDSIFIYCPSEDEQVKYKYNNTNNKEFNTMLDDINSSIVKNIRFKNL